MGECGGELHDMYGSMYKCVENICKVNEFLKGGIAMSHYMECKYVVHRKRV